jgi:hypothetical protein
MVVLIDYLKSGALNSAQVPIAHTEKNLLRIYASVATTTHGRIML